MIKVESTLCISHEELINTFIRACELDDLVVQHDKMKVNSQLHDVLSFQCNNPETESKITFMSIRHSGFLNMLDDYLLRCGVPPDALQPASYHRQLQSERESEQTEQFMESYRLRPRPPAHP